jgi:hypothetical protein
MQLQKSYVRERGTFNPGTSRYIKLGHYRNPEFRGGMEYLPRNKAGRFIDWLNGNKDVFFEGLYDRHNKGREWEVDLSEFTLKGNRTEYPVLAGRNGSTPAGNFIVAEKWENPYWKRSKTGRLYLPGDSNPIGKYLIILANPDSGKKLNSSIHSHTKLPEYYVSGNGGYTQSCITLEGRDMEDLFKKMTLGDTITIKKS